MLSAEFAAASAAIAVIALAAGFIHSAIGFGFGIVALAVVPLVIEIKAAHIVISLASVPMMIMASWSYRRGIDWKTIRPAILGAAVFLPLGVLTFERAPQQLLVRGTGVAILVMVLLSLRKRPDDGEAPADSGWLCFLAGAVSGFLAGAVSIAGPPVAAFALRQGWTQLRFKAFVTQCLLVIAAYKAVMLFARDLVTTAQLTQSLLAAPLAILGVQLGVVASERIDQRRFRHLIAIALTLAATLMLL